MAKNKTNTDAKTLELIDAIKKQKQDIAKVQNCNWKTNCSFAYDDNSRAINLHVESNINNLISIVAFLLTKKKSFDEAVGLLNLEGFSFSWQSYSLEDWLQDIQLRIGKIQISSKKKKLELLEERLNKIISPELRAEMELEAIQNELN